MLPHQPGRAAATASRSTGRIGGPHPREIKELTQQPGQPVALPHDQAGQELVVLVGLRRRASCSTELRIEASGFRISCASDADSAATASSRSAPQMQLLKLLRVGDVGEDRGDRRHLAILGLEGGGGQADREHRPLPAPVPSPRLTFRPFRMPATTRRRAPATGLQLVQDRAPEQSVA